MPGGEEKSENFYAVLGLKSDCTASELRNAYKKLAMRWHPDRWSASGNAKLAEESKKKFQAIQEAYSVLSDDNKRFLYDAGVYEDDDDDNGFAGNEGFSGEMMVMMNENKAQTNESDSFEDLQGLFMEMFEGDLNEFHNKPSMTNSCGSKRNCCGSVRMEDRGDCSFMMGVGSSFTVQSFSLGSEDPTSSRAKGGMEGDIDDDDDYDYLYLYLTLETPRDEDLTMWVVGRNI